MGGCGEGCDVICEMVVGKGVSFVGKVALWGGCNVGCGKVS